MSAPIRGNRAVEVAAVDWVMKLEREAGRVGEPGRCSEVEHMGGIRRPHYTAGGRIWYCPDPDKRVVWLIAASTGHPKVTE